MGKQSHTADAAWLLLNESVQQFQFAHVLPSSSSSIDANPFPPSLKLPSIYSPTTDESFSSGFVTDSGTLNVDVDQKRICAIINNSTGSDEAPYIVCNGPHVLDGRTHTVVAYGYITPVLVTITLLTNLLVCLVLLKSTRSPTNTLLVAMAVSDTLTGLWPVPCYVYFYTTGFYQDWLPYNWCYVYFCLTNYLPTVFHTASIWLTVCLAAQRYIYVCHPLTGKQHCSVRNAIKVVTIVYIVSFASQFTKFFELDFHSISLTSLPTDTGSPNDIPGLREPVIGCYETLAQFVADHTVVYYNFYYWFRLIFIHLVPCTSLVVLNAVLVQTMRAAQNRRRLLLRQNRRVESRRLEESTSTTMMLVTVVGLFLLVELPLAIFLLIFICDNTFSGDGPPSLSGQIVDDVSMSINLVILLSYPLNFFIYCGMSRQFRDTFRRLFATSSASSTTAVSSAAVSTAVAVTPAETTYDVTLEMTKRMTVTLETCKGEPDSII